MSTVSDLPLTTRRLWYVDCLTNAGYGIHAYFGQGNVLLESIGAARALAKGDKGQRINILQNLEGLVHNGEMLVVLGPPGR